MCCVVMASKSLGTIWIRSVQVPPPSEIGLGTKLRPQRRPFGEAVYTSEISIHVAFGVRRAKERSMDYVK